MERARRFATGSAPERPRLTPVDPDPRPSYPALVTTWERLRAARVVGVVRDRDGDRAQSVAQGLAEGGLSAVEITANTPHATRSVRELAKAHGQVAWGLGTVRDADDVERAADAGASFVVSPHFDPRVVARALALGLVPIPGALTPTEILAAHAAGAPVVKVFPISAVGGPAYLEWVRGPLPDIPLWVSGDVSLDDVSAYVAAGATLIGLTSALTRGLTSPFEASAADRARAAIAALRNAEAPSLRLVGTRTVTLSRDDLLEAGTFRPLDDFVAGRDGRAFALGPWLERAGFARRGRAFVRSEDGFTTTVDTRDLFDHGALQVDEHERPLAPSRGGPFRLFVEGADDRCSNVKSVVEIAVEATSDSDSEA
jgi:2-dehydro-3-deoxyphosphogluconate aldolase/(4S)-4-hydroxy-2-oxoglutarate aldolase